MSHDDAKLYQQWVELLGWMREYAASGGLEYVKVSDFPDYIYRMERPYDLPTTTASASLNAAGQPVLIAAVSPRHVDLKSVQLRLMGSSKHWHLHAGERGLMEGHRLFDRERLHKVLDGALQAQRA
ncbi:NADH-quinone oxidoreductase subunit 15 [Deinococcus sonorensis]|uniref:NADH-quinone oxidoreductase subunit 15 n=2 Tax=Deinococcus sonorensis TaxID=309891 RepID=A0AAU7U9P2_9DEIO